MTGTDVLELSDRIVGRFEISLISPEYFKRVFALTKLATALINFRTDKVQAVKKIWQTFGWGSDCEITA